MELFRRLKPFTLFVIAAVFVSFFVFVEYGEKTGNVPIRAAYGARVIYTLDTSLPEEPFVGDCRARGGVFNSCGSSCAPDTDICTQVCAYTCELPR